MDKAPRIVTNLSLDALLLAEGGPLPRGAGSSGDRRQDNLER